MSNNQKAIELLSQMPEPYKTWALENLERYYSDNEYPPIDIAEAISETYTKWKYTKQGYAFWDAVYNHYRFGSPLPELPLEYLYEQVVKENEDLKKKVAELERSINQAFK